MNTNTTNKMNLLYKEILDNWSVDAKSEKKEYFCNTTEVYEIIDKCKMGVIGRKGSGKTAIAEHLCQLQGPKTFSKKLSFKNFPFNLLYNLENTLEYTVPNQFISIWEYLICTQICKCMLDNEAIDITVRDKLNCLYDISSNSTLSKNVKKWTSSEFAIQLKGIGFTFNKKNKDLSWIDVLEDLKKIIEDHLDDSSYYIIFDELDEDYKDFQSEAEETNYKSMLLSLFKAVQNIRNLAKENSLQILPVVFLRSDIYSSLKDSDKNKWNESIIHLEWDTTKIKKMLTHRLLVALNKGNNNENFNKVWHTLFENEYVYMGNQGQKQMKIYDYIERSSEMRPRDFVKYVQICARIACEKHESKISGRTVKNADGDFSEYLMGETVDEVFSVLPEIEEIFDILSTIRKQSFSFSEFVIECTKRGDVIKADPKTILLTLFDVGVIGNQPSMRGQQIFIFRKRTARFNFTETMIIHRGLYKALQIF